MSPPAIETNNLTRQFDDVLAVDSLDLTVRSGEIYGFLGPNGAGKSTTINMLLDYIRPTGGSATVLGHDAQSEIKEIHQRVGVLPDDVGLYDRLTARKHVEFVIDVKDANSDPDELLERVGLADAADRKAGGFSKGMGQRLRLAMALVNDPELLILDEPTSGLDPNGARELREIVRQENERGTTVFFSSHILGQVEAVCDRVGIMNNGQMVVEDSIEGLRDQVGSDTQLTVQVGDQPDGVEAALGSLDAVESVTVEGSTIRVGLSDRSSKTSVLSTIEDAGLTVDDFTTEQASLDDLFASYTSSGADTGPEPAEVDA
ncbi:ABC-2 type transport system ATP-binding protein [Natronoarchaeum philippinense]|uniref:ABC-2 type transport system ATP-binding protein n=1 Tax=Natronoarchaeum philippinense TaxID=558529 RepID=A0A285N5K6_NATPI|nr:ABC transporter ATP-binding protein [Natronoarchaeum philippinense]SNZ04755.1 ABC-2 type transport system ATP-binding protein [Natronoarchaeum philippinense]